MQPLLLVLLEPYLFSLAELHRNELNEEDTDVLPANSERLALNKRRQETVLYQKIARACANLSQLPKTLDDNSLSLDLSSG